MDIPRHPQGARPHPVGLMGRRALGNPVRSPQEARRSDSTRDVSSGRCPTSTRALLCDSIGVGGSVTRFEPPTPQIRQKSLRARHREWHVERFLILDGDHSVEFSRGQGVFEMLLWHERIARGLPVRLKWLNRAAKVPDRLYLVFERKRRAGAGEGGARGVSADCRVPRMLTASRVAARRRSVSR
jgi:hypothetical protein